jgi:hypothetical protein
LLLFETFLDEFLVAVDNELLVEGRPKIEGLIQFTQSLLLFIQFVKKEVSVVNSQSRAGWELLKP